MMSFNGLTKENLNKMSFNDRLKVIEIMRKAGCYRQFKKWYFGK